MNAFLTITYGQAAENLPAYYRSDAFKERIRFNGPRGNKDIVEAALWLLKHIALHPNQVNKALEHLDNSSLFLNFFQVSNPLPLYSHIKDPADVQRLRTAILDNAQSKMSKAANRIRVLRETHAAHRSKMVKEEEARFIETLTWPNPDDFQKEGSGARERYSENWVLVHAFRDRVLERRIDRLNKISRASASGPGTGNWHELLQAICQEVLTPETDPALQEGTTA